ncbi:MAG: energy transducer TonB [Pyrinomonadaceae bacterium]|nr:energy transducer TonB [Pyrinomonadaceae bacterium]
MPPQPLPQVTNASLPNPNETQGKIKREKTDEPVGLPGSLSDKLSSGLGSGGGIGGGRGTGVGGGIGTGEGNGIGSGSGNGRGNGVGNGTGDGGGFRTPPPPAPVAKPKVTQAMRIVSKPRANYTDAARQNQVQGTVTLRVTFLPSGQIGSISPVSGLPYGLTEQAIAAARSIKFEPQMVNGSPVGVTKQVQYSFTIY